MFNTALNIIIAVATAFATLFSGISLILLVLDRKQQKNLEKTRLSITPKAKLSNCVDEIFFLNLSFTNESSLPISILDIKLSIPRETITDSSKGHGGLPLVYSVPVSESKTRYPNSDIIVYNFSSLTLPVTLKPFSSLSGYIAFHAGQQDAYILCHKDLLVKIRTSRKTFEINMDLANDTFYDYTYWDDETSDGDAYYG